MMENIVSREFDEGNRQYGREYSTSCSLVAANALASNVSSSRLSSCICRPGSACSAPLSVVVWLEEASAPEGVS